MKKKKIALWIAVPSLVLFLIVGALRQFNRWFDTHFATIHERAQKAGLTEPYPLVDYTCWRESPPTITYQGRDGRFYVEQLYFEAVVLGADETQHSIQFFFPNVRVSNNSLDPHDLWSFRSHVVLIREPKRYISGCGGSGKQ